MEEASENYC